MNGLCTLLDCNMADFGETEQLSPDTSMDGANQLFLDYNTSGFVEALLVYLT
jgi:hypothetical protein